MSVARTEIATLAAGCFWGVEDILRKIDGVVRTTVGYCGGSGETATYEHVKKGNTGHAEAVQVEFDPSVLAYASLLDYFFRLHDPTTLNRQGNDMGTQYRSAIFFHSSTQESEAKRVRDTFNKAGRFPRPIVTEISPAPPFYTAEEYHQKYLQKNPGGYNCHFLRP